MTQVLQPQVKGWDDKPDYESEAVFRYDIFSLITDESGDPRLSEAREEFLPLGQSRIPVLVEDFKFWQEFDEYIVLRDRDPEDGDPEYVGVKCSKRGNDVFSRRLRSRLGFLREVEGDPLFSFDDVDLPEGEIAKSYTPKERVSPALLWVTLTYDSKRCSLHRAWENIMSEFNRWITNLRNRYGRIWYVAFPQPFPDPSGEAYGYPHFHVLMLFEDAEFTVFPSLEEIGDELKLVYRVEEKSEIHSQGKWHSFIDVKALRSGRHAYNYTVAYSERASIGGSSKADLNNAVLWLYRKKSFNLSGRFRDAYREFISSLRSSKGGGRVFPCWYVLRFGVSRFELVGVYSRADLEGVLPPDTRFGWVVELSRGDLYELERGSY